MDFGKRMTTKAARVGARPAGPGLRVPQARRARVVRAMMKTIPFSTKSDKFTPLSRKFTPFFDKFKTLQSAEKTSSH